MDRLALEGRVAVVTGAGRGIGRATCEALAAAGCDVVAAARTVAELEVTAEAVRAAGRRCEVVPADVTIEDECDALVTAAMDRFGQLDVLVNNAGGARFAPFWELSAEDFDFNLSVNLRSVFLCSRAAARVMMARGGGSIVNVASSSGKKPYAHQGAYCASKAGVLALSRVMAVELRPHNVHVHAVCPGGVDTRLAAEIHPTRDKSGWIQPGDVARSILYLLTLPPNITIDEITVRRFDADPL